MATQILPLVEVPAGVVFRYSYPYRDQIVRMVGTKGPEINPGYNAGFRVLHPITGEAFGTISRHARVEIDQ